MSPQAVLYPKWKSKLREHKKDFLRLKYEYFVAPFFVDTKIGDLYLQPFVDIDAKSNIRTCLIDAAKYLGRQFISKLNLREQYIQYELTSIKGVHLISNQIFRLNIQWFIDELLIDNELFEIFYQSTMRYATILGRSRMLEILRNDKRVRLQLVDKLRKQYESVRAGQFNLSSNAKTAFEYLRDIKSLARLLWLIYLFDELIGHASECIDPRGMNHNPFRRFPSRAHNYPNRWVAPLKYRDYQKHSLTELHNYFLRQFELNDKNFEHLINEYLLKLKVETNLNYFKRLVDSIFK